MTRHIHDFVAKGYDSEHVIIAAKNRLALEMVRRMAPAHPLRAVDLGVGDGAFLSMIQRLGRPAEFTGLDVSAGMLEQARRALPGLKTVQGGAGEADRLLPAAAFDLAIAHFILAYVDLDTVLAQSRHLLADGGMLSLVTSTNESAAALLEAIRPWRMSNSPTRRMIARFIDQGMARSRTPQDFTQIEARMAAHGYSVVERHRLETPMRLNDAEEAFHFCFTNGWAVTVLAYRYIPVAVSTRIARSLLRRCRFPFEWTQVVEIVLARKD